MNEDLKRELGRLAVTAATEREYRSAEQAAERLEELLERPAYNRPPGEVKQAHMALLYRTQKLHKAERWAVLMMPTESVDYSDRGRLTAGIVPTSGAAPLDRTNQV